MVAQEHRHQLSMDEDLKENLFVYTRNDLEIVFFLVLKLGGNWRT